MRDNRNTARELRDAVCGEERLAPPRVVLGRFR